MSEKNTADASIGSLCIIKIAQNFYCGTDSVTGDYSLATFGGTGERSSALDVGVGMRAARAVVERGAHHSRPTVNSSFVTSFS